jgi:hypothetical protein
MARCKTEPAPLSYSVLLTAKNIGGKKKTLFASKPCGAPIFCVISPSIY